jgi:hypothetical protein
MLRKMHLKLVARAARPWKAHMGGTPMLRKMHLKLVARVSRPWKAHMGGTPMLRKMHLKLVARASRPCYSIKSARARVHVELLPFFFDKWQRIPREDPLFNGSILYQMFFNKLWNPLSTQIGIVRPFRVDDGDWPTLADP